jgi:hypothetical protein
MLSSRVRVVFGTVAAVGALTISGVAAAATIDQPGGPTGAHPITTNPTMPKRVEVGVAFTPLKKGISCDDWQSIINGDLTNVDDALHAGDSGAVTQALSTYGKDVNAAQSDGCFVDYIGGDYDF